MNSVMTISNRIANKIKKTRLEVNLRRFTTPSEKIPLDRPIFFLGVQGGGLNLLTRIFMRNRSVIYCRGNFKSWDAAGNELHLLESKLIPEPLSFYTNKYQHDLYRSPNPFRYWTYALDDTLSHYRYTSQDATRDLSEKLKYVLRRIVAAYALDFENVRFIDKSQLYTINVGFINKLLEGHDPFFVLVLRDPYAMCSRVTDKYYLSGSKNGFSFSRSECLKLCSEHWRNSYACALRDFSEGANSILLRFEDLISELETTVAMLCARLSINFEGDMLPAAHHKHTIYSRVESRWYPVRADTNTKYLDALSESDRWIIDETCGSLARTFSYYPDGLKPPQSGLIS